MVESSDFSISFGCKQHYQHILLAEVLWDTAVTGTQHWSTAVEIVTMPPLELSLLQHLSNVENEQRA